MMDRLLMPISPKLDLNPFNFLGDITELIVDSILIQEKTSLCPISIEEMEVFPKPTSSGLNCKNTDFPPTNV